MMESNIPFNDSKTILSYGMMPIANGFLTPEQFPHEYFFELSVALCPKTKMFHLVNQPDSTMMFHENYAFFSSTSRSMANHFEKMANHFIKEFIAEPDNDFVVEIGSNDGIMLKHFANKGIKHLGVEPSLNVAKVAIENGVNTVSEFFGEETAADIKNKYGKAKIITSSNVMCHIPCLDSVAKGVKILLESNGVFVFEDPYLGDVIQKTSYDQIYDEHAYLFSVQSVQNVFGQFDLEVFDVASQTTHGGSMRYYLCHKNAYQVRDSVKQQLAKELAIGLDKMETYERFARNCEESKRQLVNLLTELKQQGKRVVGYAATSKSTTILNYCGIGPDLIEYICDTTPIKQHKFSPGMHIPIKPYEHFKNDNPDYAVLFAWNHAEEILAKEKLYTQTGGKWIVFVPQVKILATDEVFTHDVA